MARSIDELVADATQTFRSLLTEAFDAGRDAGKQEATDAILVSVKNLTTRAPELGTAALSVREPRARDTEGRAAPGTVKPAIRSFVHNHPTGVTTEEVMTGTGVKPNSVRGTLYALQEEKAIERRGEKWFPVADENSNMLE